MTASRRALLAAAGTSLSLGLAGCNEGASTTTNTSTTTSPPPADASVDVDAEGFAPVRVSVDPGDRVSWENRDATAHDVTPDTEVGGSEDWEFEGDTVEPGGRLDHVFEERGLYAYRCTIHGREAMCGAVVVGDVSVDTVLPCQEG